jgi:SH3 domain-containing YSC84-like protein 1
MLQLGGIQLLVVSILEQREPEEVRMKRLFVLFVLAMSSVCLAQTDKSAKDDTKSKNDAKYSTDQTAVKASERAEAAATVLQEIFAAPDKGVPEDLLGSAKCAIVIPGMKKAGFVVGGRYGRGFATCRTASGWSAPAPVFLGGGSFGAQIGGEAVDVVMLVMNDKGVQQLLSSKFKIGVDASAAAGPVGRSASADTNWKLKSELLTYSRAKGLFAGIELNGAEVKQDGDTTKELYGKEVPFNKILAGKVPVPAPARPFIAEIQKDFREARASK